MIPIRKTGLISGILLAFFVILTVSGQVAAATIEYGTLAGATMTFMNITETTNTAGDPEVLYGSPTVVGDQLLFFPTQYSSESSNGSADTTSGTLQILLQAQPGHFIEKVRIQEFGDYAFAGSGGLGTQAHISGLLTVTDLAGPAGTLTDSESDLFTGSPSFGLVSMAWELDFTGMNLMMAMLSFNNTLQTSSEPGTTAFIQKKVVNGPAVALSVNPQPVPLPPAILLLGSGMLGLLFSRKKRGA